MKYKTSSVGFIKGQGSSGCQVEPRPQKSYYANQNMFSNTKLKSSARKPVEIFIKEL